jgi:hypothetical protein
VFHFAWLDNRRGGRRASLLAHLPFPSAKNEIADCLHANATGVLCGKFVHGFLAPIGDHARSYLVAMLEHTLQTGNQTAKDETTCSGRPHTPVGQSETYLHDCLSRLVSWKCFDASRWNPSGPALLLLAGKCTLRNALWFQRTDPPPLLIQQQVFSSLLVQQVLLCCVMLAVYAPQLRTISDVNRKILTIG